MDGFFYLMWCKHENHIKAAKEVYEKFPEKIKKKIDKDHIYVTDIFYRSKNPTQRVHMEPLGFYLEGGRALYIIPKYNLFSEDCIKGLIVHETAHAYIYFKSPLFRIIAKFYYKIKFLFSSNQIKRLYYYSNYPHEELYADTLANKWGFKKEIDCLNKERGIENRHP